MFICDIMFGIYRFILSFFTKLVIAFFNNLEIVLVLHRCLLSWSGLRVSPRSCPLHYPAVTCKSVTVPLYWFRSAIENSFMLYGRPTEHRLCLLCLVFVINPYSCYETTYHSFTILLCTYVSEINYLCLSMSMSMYSRLFWASLVANTTRAM